MPSALMTALLALLLSYAVYAQSERSSYGYPTVLGRFTQDIAHIYTAKDGIPDAPIDYVRLARAGMPTIVARGTEFELVAGSWHTTGRQREPDLTLVQRNLGIRQIVQFGGYDWLATNKGLLRLPAAKRDAVPDSLTIYSDGLERVPDSSPFGKLLSQNVQCLAADASGALWIGTDHGVNIYNAGEWKEVTGRDGLPVLGVRTITIGPDGSVWFGTPQGAARLLAGKWRYYAGRRWLPDDRINSIAVAPNGDAWIGTAGGVSHIEYRRISFPEKAAHYEDVTAARHNRRGYVTECGLQSPGDLSSHTYDASDNDGLWTALYLGAECFRFAATRDAAAQANARKSMDAILFLTDVTGIPGFPARAVKRKDEVCTGYESDNPNWQNTNPKYPGIFWKGDTSSDEIDGHYFAWYVYYTLVADAAEKKRITATCRAVTNHILDHNFYLIGPTGMPTTWGVWAPEKINDDPKWSDEHGLNALEILSHLKVASHICGDQRFKDAYRMLIDKHHYALNTIDQKVMPPRGDDNHSDDELAWCAYYPLLMLEEDPALRRIYLLSLERTQQVLRPQGSPYYNFLYGALTGHPCDAEAGIEWLQNAPWDCVEWTMRNSQRADIELAPTPGRAGEKQSTRVLPISERALTKWNSNPYELDAGADGRGEMDGAFWLIPYWLGRYHGIIKEAQ